MPLVVLDPGHGGANPGAVYLGRKEKDDVLKLALAVGERLKREGVDVYYTRTDDRYESPVQKALEGNAVGADYFVSLHRNASPYPNQYAGVETLVYSPYGPAAQLAAQINEELVQVGFADLGVRAQPNLALLRRTWMPAVLAEVGFLNTEGDNQLFDQRFEEVAQAVADGILKTMGRR